MFQLNHKAEIRAINVIRGKSDEAPICVTVSLDFEGVGNEPVAAALGCQEADLTAFFTDKGEARFTGITEIETWATYEKGHKLRMIGFSCDVAKVSKIRIKPNGTANFALSCNVQIQDPPAHVIEKIAAKLHEASKVALVQTGELDLPAGKDEGGEDAG